MEKLIITPKTKVLHLIETYPELEDVLIEYAPAFKKLRNPVLRKTVGRIATLQQAASVGEVNVEDLINRLRKEVGQELLSVESGEIYVTQKPSWFKESAIVKEFDAGEMLKAGEQPVNQVISDLKKLNKGEIYKMIAPFLPAPLIDKARSLNYQHWIDKINDQHYNIYYYQN